jgi:hypothetical protein
VNVLSKNGVWIALWLLLSTPTAIAGTLTASVDSAHISRNETLTLTLQYDQRSSDKPDTSALETQFNVRRQSTSSNIQIINGDISTNTIWEYELSPKRTGKLLIPSFSINGDFSEAVSIDVDEKSVGITQTDQQIYTETQLDKPKVYTQQQAIVTWRLVSRMGAPQVRFAPPHINGVITQDLGNRSYQRTGSNGNSEWVIEQRYALFPQQSGKITIPSQTFQAIVNERQQHISGFLISTPTEILRDTEEQQLDVIPPPSSHNKAWLPASSVEIFQQISGLNAQSQATAGTAFTRTIRIRAKGLSAEQLPMPDMQASNVKIYPEKPIFDNKTGSQGNIGTRDDRAAVIATQAGKLVLPAIHIAWYDINAEQWRDAELPESTLEVLPNPSAAQTQQTTTPPPADNAPTANTPTPNTHKTDTAIISNAPQSNISGNPIWLFAIGILVLALLLLVAYIFYLQKKLRRTTALTPTHSPQKNSFERIAHPKNLIDENNLHTIYHALTQQSATLNHGVLLTQPEAQTALRTLEKHLYGNGNPPSAESIQTLIGILTQADVSTAPIKKNKKPQLDNLY